MWLNSRDLSGNDNSNTTRDDVWGFTGSSQSASHGSIGASVSRTLWNRMEPAEEEREEEALPPYLSYLQPAFRPTPTTPTTLGTGASPSVAFYTPNCGASKLSTASLQNPQSALEALEVRQVTCKSSELAQALEHLVLGSVQRHARNVAADSSQTRCKCVCSSMQLQLQEMVRQVQTLQNQVLELTKNTIPTAIDVGRASSWSANAPPFVPKQQHYKQPPPPPLPSAVDQSTVTVLSDRISTLEGRQSAFQSQLAQIAKVLGISAGKQGKHSPVKHLVQTLRDEVDVKVQEARTDLMEEIRTALRDFGAGDMRKDKQQAVSMNTVLEALAGEHEASLARLSGSFEKLLAEEARQRVALEARVRSQLAQQEEWLQQLEGAFGSSHDPKHDQDFGRKDLKAVDSKLAALERRWEESRECYKRLARLLPDATSARLLLKPGEEADDEEEDGLRWPS
ncbi:hypothetical protein KXD40_009172 [Peronospora effusa]|uniref:Uncharacterized protein n=1 Tax=Peronospora effusa TaxID=542832 RepID=A0A3M6VUR5_9STRA|nr:hypothetical protein DD238_008276 [Peronospora effusa]RQM10809.1 hypothetical protein DD237_006907 [Peronospora effusa]UIZ25380.1 hypothetical protein KXD40_009172 [Peronospora effusa]CAI5707068.1 unnamed protein product [Peronospora effusa]